MYLHIGAETVVTADEIIAILDPRIARNSETGRRLVQRAVAAGVLAEEELRRCRALVVTHRGIFASTVSPQSLARRMGGALGPAQVASRSRARSIDPSRTRAALTVRKTA